MDQQNKEDENFDAEVKTTATARTTVHHQSAIQFKLSE
jgi:hypothetical protein